MGMKMVSPDALTLLLAMRDTEQPCTLNEIELAAALRELRAAGYVTPAADGVARMTAEGERFLGLIGSALDRLLGSVDEASAAWQSPALSPDERDQQVLARIQGLIDKLVGDGLLPPGAVRIESYGPDGPGGIQIHLAFANEQVAERFGELMNLRESE